MFKSFKEAWNKIQDDEPGERFARQYHRRKEARENILNRILFIGAGLIFSLVGVVMLFTPGPGIFFLFIGMGLIAQESLWLAKVLDRFEIYMRKWADWGEEKWKESSTALKIVTVLAILILCAAGLYVAYLVFFA